MGISEEELTEILRNPDMKVKDDLNIAPRVLDMMVEDAKKNFTKGRKNKYHAKRTWSELCQREFASKKEAGRAEELTLLERDGQIQQLEFQLPFRLCEKSRIKITIDFKYIERHEVFDCWNGRPTYEDSKGVLTRDTRTKLAWLHEKFGVDVILS